MEFLFSIYTVAYAAAALISGIAALVTWKRRQAPGAIWLFAMSVSCIVWALAVALDYSSVSLGQHVFWGQVSYLGATTAPVFFFIFAFAYVGDCRWGTPKRLALLLLIPALAVALAFTNSLHYLVWTGFSLVPGQPNLIIYSHGPAYWAITIYGLSITLLASVRLLSVAILARSFHRAQSVAVAIAVLLPWSVHIAYSLTPGVFPGVDSSVTLTFTSAILSFTMLRFNLLDIVPVPRSVLVEEMVDGIVVLDRQTRVVEINPAAISLLGIKRRPRTVIPLAELLVHWPEAAERLLSAPEGESPEPLVATDGMCVSIDRLRLVAAREGLERDLYVLRDVTARKRAEEALCKAVEDLKARMAEIESLQAELREQAIRDPLTGLYNRRYLTETFERELGRAAREGYPVSAVMLDIDYFKEVNDTLGHAAGDAILHAVGAELSRHRRAGDIASRYGGDEFLVVLPNTSLEMAVEIAERWRASLYEGIRQVVEAPQVRATVSLGVAVFPKHATNAGDLIAAADSAVYASKSAGRNRVSAAPTLSNEFCCPDIYPAPVGRGIYPTAAIR